jgi:SAM-dependent methyltransferase
MSFRDSVRDHMRPELAETWSLMWCDACKFGRLAGNFTAASVAPFYATGYYTHKQSTSTNHAIPFLDRLLAHLAWRVDQGAHLSLTEIGQGGAFCEIGCGNGTWLKLAKEAGYDVVGVEPDPTARALAGQIATVHEGTAERLPTEVSSKQFDLVLMSHVLEHTIDPISALANARSVLAPGGTLIVEVPNNAAHGFRSLKASWLWSDVPRHLNFFTEESLSAALKTAGLSTIKTFYCGYARQFSRDWRASQALVCERTGTPKPENDWLRLLRTAFAKTATKYDSIRVHAVIA